MQNSQISILLRIYRRTPKVMDLKTSLRKRYQIEENNRTMPLYLWISMNEILSAFAICAVFYFFKGIDRKFVLLNENDSLADTIDMVSLQNSSNISSCDNCFHQKTAYLSFLYIINTSIMYSLV